MQGKQSCLMILGASQDENFSGFSIERWRSKCGSYIAINQEKSHKLSFCEVPKKAQVFCLALLK
ncbi:MAG: hypothetical protein F6K35_09190 [Okeania sp. SIO2H7]|nr:hypothetical protein [Okeania sp. SIO2H7]